MIMNTRNHALMVTVLAAALATGELPAIAQTRGELGRAGAAIQDIGGAVAALTATVVRDAPYSATAVTTTSQQLADGTRIERTVTAKVFRDSEGRIRREQTVLGLASLSSTSDALRVVTISDPVAGVVYTLDESTRTARQRRPLTFVPAPRLDARAAPQPDDQLARRRLDGVKQAVVEAERQRALSNVLTQLGIPQAPSASPRQDGVTNLTSSLGTRQINGVEATGRRTTQTIPAGAIGNDRPIVVTDETWESAELHVVVSSRHTDPRTGTVEYRLTNIVRGEPLSDLFTVPPGYTLIPPAPLRVEPAAGARGARRGP
jgi:hypothetical protein